MPLFAISQWTGINQNEPTPAEIQLINSDINNSVLNVSVNGFTKKAVSTKKGEAFVITVDEATSILELGAPDLPKVTASIIIPDKNKMEL